MNFRTNRKKKNEVTPKKNIFNMLLVHGSISIGILLCLLNIVKLTTIPWWLILTLICWPYLIFVLSIAVALLSLSVVKHLSSKLRSKELNHPTNNNGDHNVRN